MNATCQAQSSKVFSYSLTSPKPQLEKVKQEPIPLSPITRTAPFSAPAVSIQQFKNEDVGISNKGFVQITPLQPFPLAPTPAQLGKAPLQRRLSMGNYIFKKLWFSIAKCILFKLHFSIESVGIFL